MAAQFRGFETGGGGDIDGAGTNGAEEDEAAGIGDAERIRNWAARLEK